MTQVPSVADLECSSLDCLVPHQVVLPVGVYAPSTKSASISLSYIDTDDMG